jgi:5-methyltetrahydropteroyltriglutamate--homocysteine methyltransferase
MKELATIRNDVVGSLLRPTKLKKARAEYDQDKISLDQLRQIEDQSIREAVRLQEQIGLAAVTDGEYRRLNFQDSFGESVSGYDAGKPSLKFYE